MKKLLLPVLGYLALLTSCKEVPPEVNYLVPVVGAIDTAYVMSDSAFATITLQPHNVLIEDFTGQGCANCPPAHDIAQSIINGNPGRVNVMALYITHFAQTIPPFGSVHDFRSDSATAIANSVYGSVGSMPIGGIDRVSVAGSRLLDPTLWSGNATSRLTISDSVNVNVVSSYNATTDTATVVATVTYMQPMDGTQSLSVAVVEDSMYDYQEDALKTDTGYLFTNVLRDMLTPPASGISVAPTIAGTKVKKTVYIKSFLYKPTLRTPAVNPAHCRVIAFVTGADGSVLQSVQAKLKP